MLGINLPYWRNTFGGFYVEFWSECGKVFSPEHGFRGDADAGEHVSSEKIKKTGLPIVSLYGNNKKPTQDQLKGLDVVVFDIQDVGVRFYTYISTLHYVMEACAEANIPVDRLRSTKSKWTLC